MKNFIHEFWQKQAETHGPPYSVSWGDKFAIDLEVDFISKHINPHDNVLDVGCANGHATKRQAEKQPTANFTGIDFSRKMVKAAQRDEPPSSFCSFHVGDIRKIKYKSNAFDVVYTTRTLINLPTWEEQAQGIKECIRVCKPGGKVILLEAFWEPLQKLNALRIIAGLHPLVEHDFNRYIKKIKINKFLRGTIHKVESADFSGTYYVGTRFLRETIHPSVIESYLSSFNKTFFDLQKYYNSDGFGIQQAFIITKG